MDTEELDTHFEDTAKLLLQVAHEPKTWNKALRDAVSTTFVLFKPLRKNMVPNYLDPI